MTMPPRWFESRKISIYWNMGFIYLVINYMIFKFASDMSLYFFVLTTLSMVLWFIPKRKGFAKRGVGFVVENNAAEWLENRMEKSGMQIKKGIRMRYGDIDIYIPEYKIVIDVKAFGHIDNRVTQPKIISSLQRQIAYTGARVGVIWLPRSNTSELREIRKNIYAISGKETLIQFIHEKLY